ncbi:MAG: aldo/keto reductase [Spirochaetaceae bacterium]|jgi:predicted aldo/keto reductase-like oxidoreductase|nr:aldo/keto reductase [Spirochaetaceae bacterium]
MQYVEFGKTGLKVSRLGFGCMRFPATNVNGKQVFDEDKSIAMLQKAYELGVNYYDTGTSYCDGLSESILGKGIKGFRDKILVSTKCPGEAKDADSYVKQLEGSLKRLGTDHVDFYHFWGIGLQYFEDCVLKNGMLKKAQELKEQGLIRHISFSFHDKPENMIEIIKKGEGILETVLCQYNVMDRSNEAGIKFAQEQGMGVVVMGPVGGGRLGAPSKTIQALLPGKVQSSAEVALRFVFNNPGVNIALSGMSAMEHVVENAEIASNASPLSDAENQQLEAMMQENRRLAGLYCTGCNYCMPCPQGINIPEIFTLMNYHRVYHITDYARGEYKTIGKVPWRNYKDASACVDCGVCETKCPQKLPIRQQLRETHEVLNR